MATKDMKWSEIKELIKKLRNDDITVEVDEDFPTDAIGQVIGEVLKDDLTK